MRAALEEHPREPDDGVGRAGACGVGGERLAALERERERTAGRDEGGCDGEGRERGRGAIPGRGHGEVALAGDGRDRYRTRLYVIDNANE